jgi:methylenetetrahydrofolate reductase (NADPH)
MNHGIYLEEEIINAHPTNFCVGVAGYPEKHSEAPNKSSDISHLKQKVDAGAEYIVTQMFFNNEAFFEFEKTCREAGILVPIIPGIKPLTTKNQIFSLPRTFSIDLPEALVKAVEQCTTPQQIRQVGIEWSIQQSRQLISAGVPVLHFYTMGKSDNISAIAKEVF